MAVDRLGVLDAVGASCRIELEDKWDFQPPIDMAPDLGMGGFDLNATSILRLMGLVIHDIQNDDRIVPQGRMLSAPTAMEAQSMASKTLADLVDFLTTKICKDLRITT